MRISLFMIMIAGCLMLPGCWETEKKDEPTRATPSASIDLEKVLNGASGQDKLRELIGSGNVIVDFYATWCSPCRLMLPVVDALADEYPQVKVVKVNIDTFHDIAESFKVGDETIKISSVPQFYFFKDGKKVHHFPGAREKDAVKEMINKHFNL